MHVHEFCGSWMDHPFWRSKFTLKSDSDFQRITSGGVKELWIDTGKGLDVEHVSKDAQQITRESVAEEVERELEFVASMPMAFDDLGTGDAAMAKAAALYRRSVPKIASMFGEARLGKAIDAGQCEELVEGNLRIGAEEPRRADQRRPAEAGR